MRSNSTTLRRTPIFSKRFEDPPMPRLPLAFCRLFVPLSRFLFRYSETDSHLSPRPTNSLSLWNYSWEISRKGQPSDILFSKLLSSLTSRLRKASPHSFPFPPKLSSYPDLISSCSNWRYHQVQRRSHHSRRDLCKGQQLFPHPPTPPQRHQDGPPNHFSRLLAYPSPRRFKEARPRFGGGCGVHCCEGDSGRCH